MPPINTPNSRIIETSILSPEIQLQQRTVRDTYNGSTVIKSDRLGAWDSITDGLTRTNAEYYLPAIDKRQENVKWKEQYLKEAWFPSFVTDYIDLVVGLINFNGNKYVLDVAEQELKWLVEVTDDTHGGLEALKIRINTEQCLVGQYMLVLDLFTDLDGNTQFKVAEFTSESIILHTKIDGLDHIVCTEKHFEFDPSLKQNIEVLYYRVFGLEVRNGRPRYWTAVLDEANWESIDLLNIPETLDEYNVEVNKRVFPTYHGKYLDRLPIVVINTSTLGIRRFTKVPTYELAETAIQYYRRDGRLTFGQRYAANPTAVAINAHFPDAKSNGRRDGEALCEMADDDVPANNGKVYTSQVIALGADVIVCLNSDSPQFPADIKYLEPRCDGFDSMEKSINRLGRHAEQWDLGRLLSTTGTNASAEAVSMRGQVAIADVQLVDKTSCEGISELLRLAAIWTGVPEADAIANIEFIVNTDYVRTEFTNTNAPVEAQGRQLLSRPRQLTWQGLQKISKTTQEPVALPPVGMAAGSNNVIP